MSNLTTIDRLFYCRACDFYTLDRRNLDTHSSKQYVYILPLHSVSHPGFPSTGLKPIQCPHTIEVYDSPGSPTREVRCPYRTHDRSLLGRHRKKKHDHVPRTRKSAQRLTVFTYAPSLVRSSSTTTLRVKKPKQTPKTKDIKQGPKTSKTCRPCEDKKSNAAVLDAASTGSPSSSGTMAVAATQDISPDAHDQLTQGAPCNATGHFEIMLAPPNQGISPNANSQLALTPFPNASGYDNNVLMLHCPGISSSAHGQLAHTKVSNVSRYINMPVGAYQGIPESSNAHGQLAQNGLSNPVGRNFVPATRFPDNLSAIEYSGYVARLHATPYTISRESTLANALGHQMYTTSPVAVMSNTGFLTPPGHAFLDALGQSTYGVPQNTTGSTFGGFNNTISIAADQASMSTVVRSNPALHANWSTPYTKRVTARMPQNATGSSLSRFNRTTSIAPTQDVSRAVPPNFAASATRPTPYATSTTPGFNTVVPSQDTSATVPSNLAANANWTPSCTGSITAASVPQHATGSAFASVDNATLVTPFQDLSAVIPSNHAVNVNRSTSYAGSTTVRMPQNAADSDFASFDSITSVVPTQAMLTAVPSNPATNANQSMSHVGRSTAPTTAETHNTASTPQVDDIPTTSGVQTDDSDIPEGLELWYDTDSVRWKNAWAQCDAKLNLIN